MSKITLCDNMMESRVKYTNYIFEHIENVQEAYTKAKPAFEEIFIDVFANGISLNKLEENICNHDKSKFDDEEFLAYAIKFFPNPKSKIIYDFDAAWLHHIHNNPHHPAHWVLLTDNDIKILNMPNIYIIEMLCDWMAMSKYYNSTTLEYWKSESAHKLPMSEYTKFKVEEFMKWMIKNNVHTIW